MAGNFVVGSTLYEHWCDVAMPLSLKSVRAGRAVWTLPDRPARHVIDPDHYLLVNDGERYQMEIERAPATTLCPFVVASSFDGAWRAATAPIDQLLDDPGAAAIPPRFIAGTRRLDPELRGVLDRLAAMRGRSRRIETAADSLEDDAVFHDLASLMAARLAEERRIVRRVAAVRPATRVEVGRRLLAARELIEDSLDQPLRLDDLARAACLAPHHFHRAFARAFGAPPHAYVLERRLLAARALLAGRHTVGEIARTVGFASATSFSNRFRRRFGVSPAAFRRAKKSKNG